MNSVINDEYIKMVLDIQSAKPLKVKITSKLDTYLKSIPSVFQEKPANMAGGRVGHWDGIPIEIDDTIENEYYELVYEEN